MRSLHESSTKRWALCLSFGCLLVGCSDDSDTDPALGTTVYVDQSAADGGDGSAAHPFRTVREALEVEQAFETISIGPGDYPVPSPWAIDATVTVTGADGGTTTLDGEETGARIAWTSGAKLTLTTLGFAAPFSFDSGELELADVTVSEVVGPALEAIEATTRFQRVAVNGVMEVDGQAGTGDGIVVSGGSLQWSDGSASDVPDRALVLEGATATLTDLTLTSRDRAPLTVSDGAAVTAQGIMIDQVSLGVFVDEASLELTGATISGATTAGLLASAGSTTIVTDSTFSNCPEGHVALIGAGASLTLERNRFENAANNACISAAQTDGSVVIRDNQIDGCAGGGITLSHLTGAEITGNEVANITPDPLFEELADGITLYDAEGTVSGNTVHHTDGYGISLIRGQGIIADNVVGPVDGVGISIVELGGARVQVAGNTITQARGAGVMVLEAAADLTDNTISETIFLGSEGLGDGIAFGLGADVTATGNQCFDNGTNGIVFLDGVTGELTGNTLTANNLYGIKEHCTGPVNQVTLTNNIFADNGMGPTDLCSP